MSPDSAVPELDYTTLIRQWPTATRAVAERRAGATILWRVMMRLGAASSESPHKAELALLWRLRSRIYAEIVELSRGGG